ncbi:MAG: sodium:solute symporter [Candidatus Hydrogenedentota bacterium]
MLGEFRALDVVILVGYFGIQLAMGPYFARRQKSTESYFVGNRSYPAWLLGISMFGTSISSITFVALPADSYKRAWLLFLIYPTLPIAMLIASKWVLPFFRRTHTTSAFEYLEGRFGPGTRVYAALMFNVSQCIRLSLVLYLVSALIHALTGWNTTACIVVGGSVTAFYTVLGGIEAVIWTDFVQSIVLSLGGLLILATVVWNLPEGFSTLFSVAAEHNKFVLGVTDTVTNQPVASPIAPRSLHEIFSTKTVLMVLVYGFFNWMTEYSGNQNVVQKWCTAESANAARRAMWINCLCSLPTWTYFYFLGTALFVFYQVYPDPEAAKMLTGERKAEDILPYFVSMHMYQGVSGLVIAGVLAAAMSTLSSSINAISAVTVTDIYKRHLAPEKSEGHYIFAAKSLSFVSSIIMILGAYWLSVSETNTLQDSATILNSISAGGLLGLFMLGFLTMRGDGRAVFIGIVFTVLFSGFMSLHALGRLPEAWSLAIKSNFDTYYTTIIGNCVMFTTGYLIGMLLPTRRNLANLTIWTQDEEMRAL